MSDYPVLSPGDISRMLVEYGEEGRRLRIICHVNPDGDTVGCAAALWAMARDTGCRAEIICQTGCPAYLRFLVDGSLSGSAAVPFISGEDALRTSEDDCIAAVDVASPAQLGALSPLIPKIRFMIDHHHYGDAFAPSLVISDISACGEVMFDIFKIMYESGLLSDGGAAMAARALYSAVSSDTGSFKYSSVTSDTLRCAAYLLDIIKSTPGLPADDISRRLHDTRTLGSLRATCAAAENLHLYCGGTMAVTVMDRDTMVARGIADDDTGSIVDVPRSVEGVLCAVALKEKGDGSWKVSSRSAVDINMAEVCAVFGGGGHVRAAGCSLPAMSAGDALKKVSSAFGDAVQRYLEKEIH